jgi:alanine dehydrogenase
MITIDADTIAQRLKMSECIGAMEDLYQNEDFAESKTSRTIFHVNEDSVILVMPGYSPRLKRFALKIVTEYKENPTKYSLPVQGGPTLLMNSENSETLALLDSPAITAIRTGAVSGLATKLLSRSDSKVVATIGTGQQARSMLEAVITVRPKITKIRAYSRNRENARRFAGEMSEILGIDVEEVSTSSLALKGADIANVATNSSTPVLKWSDVPRGIHINSVGTLPDRQELDLETVSNSGLFVDTKEGVLKDAGDVIFAIRAAMITEESIIADLSELVRNTTPGRETDSQVTLFKSVGMSLQDVYAANKVHEMIRKG